MPPAPDQIEGFSRITAQEADDQLQILKALDDGGGASIYITFI